MSCTDAEFGADPWKDQEKQCWCEDKPAYKPWRCAEDGQACMCDGGYVVYGAKLGAEKEELDFFGAIKVSMAATGMKGKKSVECSSSAFDGADPAPDAAKVCFCDSQKKFLEESFVKATKAFWKANLIESQSESELTRTAAHVSEVVKAEEEKETAGKESTSAAEVENAKAATEVGTARTCAIASIEESYKFKKIKLTQRKVLISKTIAKRKAVVTQWSF